MAKFMVVANRAGMFKRTTRTLDANDADSAMAVVMAETDGKGKPLFSEIIMVWERVRHVEVKREMRLDGR